MWNLGIHQTLLIGALALFVIDAVIVAAWVMSTA